ncbi:hypothetical protein AAHA92_08305 [Salvia divinorum]|uniref:Uncharacterized protein n=1 Tax=Salvia divinorum TaxID=28513 RepID=A0ABD1HN73_SALDI
MKYLRLHKSQAETSFAATEARRGSNEDDDRGVDNQKVKSLMEAMHRAIAYRSTKNPSSKAAAPSGSHLGPKRSTGGTNRL